jgi:cystathionine gamma-synthase
MDKLRTGYPRFFFHPLINEVRRELVARHGGDGEEALPFPDEATAWECAAYAGAQARVDEINGIWATFFPADALSRARAYWQHTGKIFSSRAAEDWLHGQGLRPADTQLEETVKKRLAGWSGAPAQFISLHPSGMAAIYAAFQTVTRRRPGKRTVMFGFPYTDTLKILEKFGAGVEFYPQGDAEDLQKLEALLGREEIAGIFCEFPSNPLLRVPDLPALHEMAARTATPVIVDDTIGTCFNVDVLPYSDMVATSLTKAISGEGDVMAGALTTSPRGLLADQPPQTGPAGIYARDLTVLEKNSGDFPERMKAANGNALRLALLLSGHPRVEKVYYPGLDPSPVYAALRKPGGGYSAVLSFAPHEAAVNSPGIFDKLQVSHGISLGTTYTLVCPYVQLAHFRELDWVRGCGIDPYLLRVAVGTEPWEELQARFLSALQ